MSSKSSRGSLRDCSETSLLSLILQRHEAAWVEFIHRYRGLMYHCINKVVGRYKRDAVDVESDEIYAEVLVMLVDNDMRKLRMYNPERGTKLGSWIGMLSINAAHDYLRSAARRPWLERLDPEPEALPSRRPQCFNDVTSLQANSHWRTPLDQLLEKERWSHLEEVLNDFSSKDRKFLSLYYSQGLDALGVAKNMAISIKTVYSKKHKIREHLVRSVRAEGRTCAIRDLAVA